VKYSELTDFQKENKRYTITSGLEQLTPDEYRLYASGFKIKGDAPYSEWMAYYALRDKIDTLVKSDAVELEPWAEVQIRNTGIYLVSDNLDGVLNHANGKVYDSKSKYYADLKASGHVVVESGMEGKKRTDYDVRKELKQAAQQHGLIG